MAESPRRSQARIAYSGTFAVQSDFNTPLLDTAIDTLFNLIADSEPRLEFVMKNDEIIDCTGQYLEDRIMLAKSCRLSFDIEGDATEIAGLLGWIFGVVSSKDRLMLGPTVFQPPATTFIYGHDDAAGKKLKLTSMVGEEIRISGRVTERIRVSLVFRGNGSPAADDSYAFPTCTTPTPIRLSDGVFLLNSVDRTADLRQIEFQFSNNLLADEDPFTAASPDITRMERADRRTNMFSFTLYGQPGDATHLQAIAYTKMPIQWTVGPGTDGIELIGASAILSQAAGPGHDGQARRSVLGLQAEPIRLSGNAATPVKATVIP